MSEVLLFDQRAPVVRELGWLALAERQMPDEVKPVVRDTYDNTLDYLRSLTYQLLDQTNE